MELKIRSAEEMVHRIAADPVLLAKIKSDPVPELQKLAAQIAKDLPPHPKDTDPVLYRIVVGALGISVIVTIIGSILLIGYREALDVPQILTAIGSASFGALAGLLAPTPVSRQ
jgi:hypothetical protein